MKNVKDLSKGNYIGKVIYNEDPTYAGRCKIKVYGLMDDLDDVFVPWFSPGNISTFSSEFGGGNFSVPKIGAFVRVKFSNNDIFSGEYTCIQNVDPYIKKLIKDDYLGTHVLLYDCDQELIIAFQPHSGLTILYKDTKFNISPTNVITLSEPGNNSIITIDNDTINISSTSEINIEGKGTVNVTSDVVNIDGDSVNVGKYANVPAVNGTELLKALKTLGNGINECYPKGAPIDVNGFDPVLSSSVKISI